MEQELELQGWLRRNGVDATFRALAALLPGAAVVVTDASRRVLYWSPEAERLFGHPASSVVGRGCPSGVVCDDDAGVRPFGAAVRVPRADGSSVYIRQYSTVFSDGQAPTGAIHVLVLDAAGHAPPPTAIAKTDVTEFHGLVTRDPGMIQIIQVIRNVAETDASVLVRGESGTGKELVARAIHLESRRRGGPFVAVNCAAFTPTLLESELFGHAKGAFTGAVAARKGIFAQADGGTLFLDEVAELSAELQAKLLRVLQEREYVPVGGTEPVAVDVRVVAATHRALREEVRAGRFREDLMFRLRVVPIFLPSLRQRPLDIDLLLRHFTEAFNRAGPRVVAGFSAEAMRALLDHSWHGNVRELRNVVEYAFAVGRGPTIGLDELPPELREKRREPGAQGPGALAIGATTPVGAEADRIRGALEEAGGDLDRAAAMLGVSRTTFWRMRKRAGV
ncbi:MAG: sigma 54-interacting transcriptional regulator [Pseudomonadota bacterium]|nr:sigma 54-interacting transcriptional regulator [Pseudomonadota bacterium]